MTLLLVMFWGVAMFQVTFALGVAAVSAVVVAQTLPKQALPFTPARASVADLPYGDQILVAAERYGLEPAVLAAVVQIESNGDPDAVSDAGAMGLGQLMPVIVGWCGDIDPLDSAENLDCSARFLAHLVARYTSLDLAVAAYHAGEPLVDACGCIPRPVDEEYVRRFHQAYQSLAGLGKLASPYHLPTAVNQGYHAGHLGIDIEAGCGVEVYAPLTGVITFVGRDGYIGPHSDRRNGLPEDNTMLVIDDGAGTQVVLLHGRYTAREGQPVTAGETPVGYEDTIGNSTGCHTHLEVLRNGQHVDPAGVLP
ncbi:MAG: transglycosylase SLT domain-containing protein [Chloroflexi bacterium]|nr:transglycosylase SLT domain-containing protein [Chloroflexota bacterium]